MCCMTMMMRLLRFALLLSSTWATQWQQQQQQYVPLKQQHQPELYHHDATIQQAPQHDSSAILAPTTDTVVNSPLPSEHQVVVPHEQQQQQSLPDEMPDMNLEHISLSLRLTCEMNRRLLQGIRNNNHNNNNNNEYGATPSTTHNPLLQRGGDGTGMNIVTPQHHPVNIHPSQSWQPPIAFEKRQSNDDEELSIFHAKSPRHGKKVRRGVARWGPDLLPYLKYLVETVLEIPSEQRSLILALSLVYLDRACSVETIRSSGCPKVPFVTPRTIHRLVLISLYTATRAVLQQQQQQQQEEHVMRDAIQKSVGIPSSQLEQMQHSFMHALGDYGLYVDPVQLQTFMNKWQAIFDKTRSRVPPPQQVLWA